MNHNAIKNLVILKLVSKSNYFLRALCSELNAVCGCAFFTIRLSLKVRADFFQFKILNAYQSISDFVKLPVLMNILIELLHCVFSVTIIWLRVSNINIINLNTHIRYIFAFISNSQWVRADFVNYATLHSRR